MQNALIVYNKTSGIKDKFDLVAEVKKILAPQCAKIEVFELVDWSGEIYQKYDGADFDLIVAIGGDGTVNTCATLILNYLPQATLKIIPAGTSNTLSVSIGNGISAKKNIKKLDDLEKLKPITMDVGQINNERYFLEAVIIGYVSKVVAATPQWLKNHLGFFGYLLTFLRHLKPGQHHFHLEIDGQPSDVDTGTIIIANTINILGLRLRRKNDFTNGLLEVMYMTSGNFISFMWSVVNFFFSTKKVTSCHAKEITIAKKDFNEPISAQIDGDEIDWPAAQINIKIIPSVLKIII